jgi:enoyl-CoA hydratase
VNSDEPVSLLADPAVTVQHDGAVAVVRLARPANANAMDAGITDALLAAIRALADDPTTRAMVLTGDGSAFSAGGDIDTIRAMREDPDLRGAVLGAHQDLFWTMTRLPFATVAAVNGPAVGAGVTVALLCDLVVMAQDAFLSDPRVSLGLLDGAGGFVLWPLLTSLSAAKEHLLLGDHVTGAEAHRLGLANRVVPTAETLAQSLDLAHRLAGLPTQAVRETRRLLNSHIERAATVLDDCAHAEIACFDTKEHRVLVEQLSAKAAARTAGDSS